MRACMSYTNLTCPSVLCRTTVNLAIAYHNGAKNGSDYRHDELGW